MMTVTSIIAMTSTFAELLKNSFMKSKVIQQTCLQSCTADAICRTTEQTQCVELCSRNELQSNICNPIPEYPRHLYMCDSNCWSSWQTSHPLDQSSKPRKRQTQDLKLTTFRYVQYQTICDLNVHAIY